MSKKKEGAPLKRVIRKQLVTKKEAAANDKVRRQVEKDFPPLRSVKKGPRTSKPARLSKGVRSFIARFESQIPGFVDGVELARRVRTDRKLSESQCNKLVLQFIQQRPIMGAWLQRLGGYKLSFPTSGGKAGRGNNVTSTVQVRDRDNCVVKQVRYKVADSAARFRAARKALEWIFEQNKS